MNSLPLRLVYSDKSALPIGDHVFHSGKYRGIKERLLQAGAFNESAFLPAPRCQEADLLLVHTRRANQRGLRVVLAIDAGGREFFGRVGN